MECHHSHLQKLLASLVVTCAPAAAFGHISVSSGPGFANTTQEITFGVGHGCAGTDTYRVRIEIPMGVTSVRALRSDFGKATVEKDAAGLVTAVVWQKADAEALDSDTNYYKLGLRLKVPDQPFTTLYFPAHQTCRAANGTLSVVDWVGLPTSAPVDGGEVEPAPALQVMPPRRAGWNKVVVAAPIADVGVLFADALIVWRGSAAYSSNPNTTELIKTTAGVTALASAAAGDELWVKY